MLPWVTSTCSAAEAFGASASKAPHNANSTTATILIPDSPMLLTQHLARVEIECDLLPLGIAVRRQLVGLARVDRTPRRFCCRARKGIMCRHTCRLSRQLWRLCDRSVRFQMQFELHDEFLRMRRADRWVPAFLNLA